MDTALYNFKMCCAVQDNSEILKDDYQGDFVEGSTPDVVVNGFVCFLFLIVLCLFFP